MLVLRNDAAERTIHLRQWLTAVAIRRVLRRAISIVCAVAFFTVGLVHSMQHAEVGFATSVVQLVAGTNDDSPDAPKAMPAVLEHCFACTVIGVPVMAKADIESDPRAVVVPLIARDRPAHPSAVEIRPPIAII